MAAQLEHDHREVGVDPHRMARADRHLARYVDDGRLAGYQLLVTRRGRVCWWREGVGFAVSDLSMRGGRVGFPHVCGYRVRPMISHSPSVKRDTIVLPLRSV